MPNYHRTRLAGGTYFFTVVSYQRRPILCDKGVRAALRQAIHSVRSDRPFKIDAWVLLPDHLHCIWTLPANDADFSTRWAMIKRFVTKHTSKATVGCVSRTVKNGARSAPYAPRSTHPARLNTEPDVGCVSRTVKNGARSAPYAPRSAHPARLNTEPDVGCVSRTVKNGARSAPYAPRSAHPACLNTDPDVGCVSRTVVPRTVGSRTVVSRTVVSSKQRRHEGFVWQRRFWEHAIRNREDMRRCIDYIHNNPVKHGHVGRVADWPFSSFHRYVRRGIYTPDWGGHGAGGTGPP